MSAGCAVQREEPELKPRRPWACSGLLLPRGTAPRRVCAVGSESASHPVVAQGNSSPLHLGFYFCLAPHNAAYTNLLCSHYVGQYLE